MDAISARAALPRLYVTAECGTARAAVPPTCRRAPTRHAALAGSITHTSAARSCIATARITPVPRYPSPMRSSTWVAGCIAGVVAACTGAGLEAVGDTMADAGRAMAGAGGTLSTGTGNGGPLGAAGRALEGLGGALAGAGGALAGHGGSAGSSSAAAQSVGDGLPNPRWVLRDKDGAPVEAQVNLWANDFTPHFGKHTDKPARECISVQYMGSQRVGGLTYRLDTGKIAETCSTVRVATVVSDTKSFLFLDAACSGTAYVDVTAAKNTYVIAGQPHYVETEDRVQVPASTPYKWTSGACAASSSAGPMYPVVPIPAPYDALPRAPYTLELVY